MANDGNGAAAPRAAPLPDAITESRRLVEAAAGAGQTIRLLGGVAVNLQAPAGGPLLPRPVGDIDIAIKRDGWRAVTTFLKGAGYTGDEMFNALHGARRLLFYDNANDRKLDVFVGQFGMCHDIPIADRLERDPMTIPLAELLLTKLQIIELTERDLRDIYNLVFHHNISDGDGSGIEADFIADLCARDWGLWRTCTATIKYCLAKVPEYPMPAEASQLIAERLKALLARIEQAPKTSRWKLRSRVGDRVRWYDEPEENTSTA
jgi:hypothetical protein